MCMASARLSAARPPPPKTKTLAGLLAQVFVTGLPATSRGTERSKMENRLAALAQRAGGTGEWWELRWGLAWAGCTLTSCVLLLDSGCRPSPETQAAESFHTPQWWNWRLRVAAPRATWRACSRAYGLHLILRLLGKI